jgi:hypothetical protein
MPRVTIRTGILAADGQEEKLSEYLCDWPDCPNIATEVVGCVKDVGLSTVMCHEHAVGSRTANVARAKRSTSA